jgi:hypothetical protein
MPERPCPADTDPRSLSNAGLDENSVPLPGFDTLVEQRRARVQNVDYSQCYTFGSVVVSDICMASMPCTHSVFFGPAWQGSWSGPEIVTMLQERQLPIPQHFQCYLSTSHDL